MIDQRQNGLIGLIVVMVSALCFAADFFPTEARRAAFLRALERVDRNYDEAEQMLRAEFSSPGYHTTLKGGTVHRTRNSLEYAVALLDSGEPEREERAEAILRRVIALQDQDPDSRTYGIWSWFLEEPLDQMSPPDWNWADFCGTQLLQVAIDHMDRLPSDLRRQVKDSILHAARSIVRRNVGPGYTNIALMGTYVTLVAGERFDVRDLVEYGRKRLRRFCEYTDEKGSFSEYNSPTYTCVAIEEISRMRQHVRDKESQELLRDLNEFAWQHVARRFHAPTEQWAGPHSRSYATLLRNSTLAFLQRADGKVGFVPKSEAWESIDAHRIKLECPAELLHHFRSLGTFRTEIEAFVCNKGDTHDIIGTTHLHPDFALGSVNIGDLWNQRRPLIGYWQSADGPAAVRLRFLHDDYDYSSASLFTVQDEGDVFGAVLFATDRGDTHISLDKIRNATITARDLRLRLQFEGDLGNLRLPDRLRLGEPMRFNADPIEGTFCVHSAEFTGRPVRIEAHRQSDEAWIDVVLYKGSPREFDFSRIEEAAIIFTLSMAPTGTSSRYAIPSVYESMGSTLVAGMESAIDRKIWSWQRSSNPTLALTIPTRPLPTKKQRATTSAKLGERNPWKFSYTGETSDGD